MRETEIQPIDELRDQPHWERLLVGIDEMEENDHALDR